MDIQVRFGTKHIDWEEALVIIEDRLEGVEKTDRFLKACATLKTAFENSYLVCSLYHNQKLIGICRALSDGVRQSVIYDLNVAQSFRKKGFGKTLMENVLLKLPVGPVILYAVPGKENYYRKFGFQNLLTGMAKFPDPERGSIRGFI